MATNPLSLDELERGTDDLDEDEVSTVHFWERKQRELISNVVDYNLGSIADLVARKTINVSPSYQRRMRWEDERSSKLIESFLMNVPVPPIFLNEDSYGRYSVIDGKQRLTAIHEFMRGRLRLQGLDVFNELNGKTFDDLPDIFQEVIKTRPTIRAVIVLRQSDEDVKFEVFRRLNTGGVRLNAQEIRNSVFPGRLNDNIIFLSENTLLHRLLGIRDKNKSRIHQEMRDCEFVVRYFALKDDWRTYGGGMRSTLDHFMAVNQHSSPAFVSACSDAFCRTLEKVNAVFGEFAFRRWLPDKGAWRNQVVAALYDVQMFGLQEFDLNELTVRREDIVSRFKGLLEDSEFRKATDAATNTPSFFISRISRFREAVVDALQL